MSFLKSSGSGFKKKYIFKLIFLLKKKEIPLYPF